MTTPSWKDFEAEASEQSPFLTSSLVQGESPAAFSPPLSPATGERWGEAESAFHFPETGQTYGETQEYSQTQAYSETQAYEEYGEGGLSEETQLDPYLGIRAALSPAHTHLSAEELAVTFGGRPALLALHTLLASGDAQQAVMAALLGRAGRQRLRVQHAELSIPAYLRLLSRLCREAAEACEGILREQSKTGMLPANDMEVQQPGGKVPQPATAKPLYAGRASSTTMRFGIDTNTDTTPYLPSLVATPIQDPVSGEAGGLDFIMRYLGRIKIAEVTAIHAAGLKVVSIVERTPDASKEELIQRYHAYFTFKQGKEDGKFGIKEARALGQTASTPIYFAVDYDDLAFNRGDFSNIIDYFNGVNTAMSDENFPFEVGVYGGGCVLKECQARQLAVRFWQANALGWCGNKTRLPFTNVVQQPQVYFPGTKLLVDYDFSPNGDEGSW